MEGRERRETEVRTVKSGILTGVALALVASMVGIAIISADEPQPGSPAAPRGNLPSRTSVVRVEPGANGVVVFIRVEGNQPGQSTSPGSGASNRSGSSGSNCSVTAVPIGNASARGWFGAEAPQHPGQVPFGLYCNNAFQGLVWLPTGSNPNNVQVAIDPGMSIDPRNLALNLLERISLPSIRIGANPETGLVALPAWFWLEGYDGAPITHAESLLDVTVEVELSPTGYRWSFGDGASLKATSPGRAYPQESDIRHAYEQSSLVAGGAYTVTLEVTFAAQFRVNGGALQSLPSITRTLTSEYPVQQIQSVLTKP